MVRDKDYWRNETVGFLALSTIKGVGYWTLHRLAESGISFKELLKNSEPEELEQALHTSVGDDGDVWHELQQTLWEKGVDLARRLGLTFTRLIFREQEEFPDSLRALPDGPHWIFVQGNHNILFSRSVAIVGTRKPSDDGLFLTKYLLASLDGLNLVTVSGLASGIDQQAHFDSIRYNIPTIAVLGNGIFNDYPKGSEVLRKAILERGGAIISEYLPYQSYSAENFVRRNRLQAGLADIVFPVEWKIKSGTAHTVDFAFKYNKKIANIYLPQTYKERPEINFSEREREAVSFSIPLETTKLIEFLKNEDPKPVTDRVRAIQGSLDL